MSSLCIIFDNDGTLVDSERLGCQAFSELVPELGVPVEVLVERYRGKRLAHVLDDMSQRIGRTLSVDEFEPAFRARTAELFHTELACMPGVREMLPRLRYPYCLASNGPRIKIEQTLRATRLTEFFGERIFSAYDVGHWKPDPGLFLHAAHAMGFTPDQCLVVEDSPTGLLAAEAAGMTGLFYTNEEPYGGTAIHFDHMDELPGLIDRIALERGLLG